MFQEVLRKNIPDGVWTVDIDSHPGHIYKIKAFGYNCVIRRDLSSWTYTAQLELPSSHPDFNENIYQIDVKVHRLQYTDESKGVMKIRFDLSDDLAPAIKSLVPDPFLRRHYWTYEEVKIEIEQLAEQFHERELCHHILFYRDNDIYGYLSNWYPAPFKDKHGIEFCHAGQYIMFKKAKLMNDIYSASRILQEKHQKKIKDISRENKNFNALLWNEKKEEIVTKAIRLKFREHSDLKERLLNTGERIIAKASPTSTIWGIGLSINDPNSKIEENWKGTNLLGKILKKVRDDFRDKLMLT